MSRRNGFFAAIALAPAVLTPASMRSAAAQEVAGPVSYKIYYQTVEPTTIQVPVHEPILNKQGKPVYGKNHKPLTRIKRDEKHRPVTEIKTVMRDKLHIDYPPSSINIDYTDADGKVQKGDFVSLPVLTASNIMIAPVLSTARFSSVRLEAVQIDGHQFTAAIARDGDKNHLPVLFGFPAESKCDVTNAGVHNVNDVTKNFEPPRPNAYSKEGPTFRTLGLYAECSNPAPQ